MMVAGIDSTCKVKAIAYDHKCSFVLLFNFGK